ncbi:AtpZ/AtpI family protein [Galbibacter orientalis]|uniref:Putative F0F1-ATPase subunit n=1 Tax=Galbibacter orientalis DSM 19592 TaxID=926559 RepID=I3C437_9FLAO|nr:AtpZ/AtpI family protein [Galbibacter orientalis]EIJ38380.1 Putative F0F1-ATPase subunit [Galbibacter orientalis DSM 19592]
MDKNNQKQTKNQLSSWVKFTNIGLQMAIIIAAGTFFGVWLDKKFPNEYSAYTIVFSLLAVFASLYNVYRQVKALDEKESSSKK